MLHATLSLFATVLSAQLEEKPLSAPAAEPVLERGSPALFSWGDADGDARLDLAAVSAEGGLQLLANAGEGRFEDVTERAGLAGIANAALALWLDYDADGRLDLFVGARSGTSRLFHNEGGLFVDMTAASGLASEGAVRSAHALDHDGDGRLDLHVVTAEKSELCSMVFRGLEGGFFERSELPLAGTGVTVRPSGLVLADAASETPSAPGPSRDEPGPGRRGSVPGAAGGKGLSASPAPPGAPSTAGASFFPFPMGCATSVQDQANPSTCVLASTTPTLGRLYPISTNLFVAVGGNVGVGTTSPTARLEVAGTARMTDTLTLAPAGDTALDVSTGSIYKGGLLFLHTKGGSHNTALGREALASVTTGYSNMASGADALRSNTTGFRNTASGADALRNNTTGFRNTASGAFALFSNTIGTRNTASGYSALRSNSSGFRNTASGAYALYSNTTGFYNTASGVSALRSNTTGFRNTASGAYALRNNTSGFRNTASGAYTLFSNTTGFYNTASGVSTLRSNTTGTRNTASGYSALRYNTSGYRNTASGVYALFSNTTGSFNTAGGVSALRSNTTGVHNTASGAYALYSNTTGHRNTASGVSALRDNTTGDRNIALGYRAGTSTNGSNNIAIGNYGVAAESATIRLGTAGTHTRAFIAGIRGVTTDVADAIPVLIDSTGQLGTVSSSRRFKEEIEDMGDRTERLLQLRPVVFRYKPEVQSGERPLEYGLIAEEVEEVFPELVVHDEDGKPFTVKYHLLSAMLLNELKAVHERLGAQEARLAALEGRVAATGARPETP